MSSNAVDKRIAAIRHTWGDIRRVLSSLEGATIVDYATTGDSILIYPPGTRGHSITTRAAAGERKWGNYEAQLQAHMTPVLAKVPRLNERWRELVLQSEGDCPFDLEDVESYGLTDICSRLASLTLTKDDGTILEIAHMRATTFGFPLQLFRYTKCRWHTLDDPTRQHLVEILTGCLATHRKAAFFRGRDGKSLDSELPLEVSCYIHHAPRIMPHFVNKCFTLEELVDLIQIINDSYAPLFTHWCKNFFDGTVNFVSRESRKGELEHFATDTMDVLGETGQAVEGRVNAIAGTPDPAVVFETKEELSSYIAECTAEEKEMLSLRAGGSERQEIAEALGQPVQKVKNSFENVRNRSERIRDGKPVRKRKAR